MYNYPLFNLFAFVQKFKKVVTAKKYCPYRYILAVTTTVEVHGTNGETLTLEKGKNAMSAEYDRHTGKFLGTLAQAMPLLFGVDMDYWNDHPVELQEVLKKALVRTPKLDTWKRVRLGANKDTPEVVLRALTSRWHIQVGPHALEILANQPYVTSPTENTVDMVLVYQHEIRADGLQWDAVLAKGREYGLGTCTSEMAVELCKQTDIGRLWNIRFHFAMKATVCVDGQRSVLGFQHYKDEDLKSFLPPAPPAGRWLTGGYCPEVPDGSMPIMFVRLPKKGNEP